MNLINILRFNKQFFSSLTSLWVSFMFCIPLMAQEISYLDLASFFIKDKNYSRAAEALAKAYDDIESYSIDRYFLLKGLHSLRTEKPADAEEYLLKAATKDDEKNLAAMYLAELFFTGNRLTEARQWIEKVDLPKVQVPEVYVLKAKIYWKIGLLDESFAVLDNGERVYPQSWRWLQAKIGFLVDRQLYRSAYELALAHLNKVSYLPQEVVRWASLFASYEQREFAGRLLERANLVHPYNPDVLQALGSFYVDQKMYLASSHFYKQLAYLNPAYVSPTVDLLRKVHRNLQAENLHMEELSNKERIKTKIALLIDQEAYDRVALLDAEVDSMRIKSDEIDYAIAYSQFVTGSLDKSVKRLTGLESEAFVKKGSKLLSLISQCQERKGECSGSL